MGSPYEIASSQLENELTGTIARLCNGPSTASFHFADSTRGDETRETFEISFSDMTSTGRLRRAALERARDLCSAIAAKVNAIAPAGILWAVRLVFFRRTTGTTSGEIVIFWAVEPE